MDEEKDLVSDNQDSNVDSNSDNLDDGQNASENASDEKLGNGYNGFASSNREAYARGLGENYDERIARNQAKLNESRARAANPNKENKDGEEVDETSEDNSEKKSILDKAHDKADVLRDKTELMASKVDKVRSNAFKVMHPGEAAKMALKFKIKSMLLPIMFPLCIGVLVVSVVFISVLILTGYIEPGSGGNGNLGHSSNGECGFTISTTSLSKSQYKEKLKEYSLIDYRAKVFYDNADNIYDLASASNINPELVMVRAVVEGYSPGSYKNNYWGMGCCNGCGAGACINYSTFMEGVKGYVDNISQYSSLIDMMSSYAYIGDKWVEGNSADGGCYYFEHIKDYYADSAEAQKSKSNAEAACNAGGTGIATTQHDQDAYASWQVNNKMFTSRQSIFGLNDENKICAEGDGTSTGKLINPASGYSVTSEFGPRSCSGCSKYHRGIDIGTPINTDVKAADGGTVVEVVNNECGARGHYVTIEHGDIDGKLIYTRYQHLESILVSVGDKVTQGQVVAKSGDSGRYNSNCTGTYAAHLHFEILENCLTYAQCEVNPRKYITF